MGTLDDIKNMQKEGKSEQEISAALQAKGVSQEEITSSMAQSKIKEAVSQPTTEPQAAPETPSPNDTPKKPATTETPDVQEQNGMQPSMMSGSKSQPVAGAATATPAPTAEPAPGSQTPQDILPESLTQTPPPSAAAPAAAPPAPAAAPAPTAQAPPREQVYSPAQPLPNDQQVYQPDIGAALSSDTITEISEQVVSEKLSAVTEALENVLDLKTTMESKIDYMDERLKRIEGIIDRLQLSILQKVGDYVTNVNDMKTELAETQKSFKALLPKQTPPKKS